MTTASLDSDLGRARSLREKSGNADARARKDGAMRLLMMLAVASALVPLAAIVLVTVQQGLDAFGWDFITQNPPFSVNSTEGGYANGFFGTFYMVGIAILLSVPLGIAAAVYLVEYPESRPVGSVRFFTDVMTGVPSIFVGVFVYAAIVSDAGYGFGTFAGAFALAILMLPIVVRSAEEILRLVPADLRGGAYALGARRWQSVVRIVLPAASPGLVTGSMLAVARAVGETAPLIFTAVGANEIVTQFSGRPQEALTLSAFEDARSFADAAQQRGWAGAFSLIAITLILTVIARYVSRRWDTLST